MGCNGVAKHPFHILFGWYGEDGAMGAMISKFKEIVAKTLVLATFVIIRILKRYREGYLGGRS